MATTILDTFITIFEYKVEGLEKVDKAAKKVTDIGKTMQRKVTAPIVAGFGGMVFAASKFEDGLDNVLNLLDSSAVDKYSGALEEQQKQAVKNGFALDDVNQSMFDNVSALGKGEKAMENFDIAQKLAIGGNADLSVAIDGQTSILNAYGKETTNATKVANAFFTAQRAGKTDVSQLASNVGKVAPIAKQAGLGFELLLASMAELTLGGLSTDEATTALRQALNGLIKPTDAARAILEEYNVPIGAAALQNADFTETLQKLTKAAEENPDVMAEMFPNIRAFTAISALGSKQVGHLNETVNQINKDFEEGTGLLEAYNRRVNNTSNETKQMWGQLQVAAKVLGDHLIPFFLKGVNAISRFFEWLENLSPATQKVILVTMALAAAIGPLLVGIGNLARAVIAIRTLLLALQAAQIGLNLAFLACPITWIVLGIAALVTWFAIAYKKTNSLTKAFQLMGSQLLVIGQRILKFMLFPINMLVKNIAALIALMSKIPGMGKLKGVAEGIKKIQGELNLGVTGSSSVNPFAGREKPTPFSPLPQTATGKAGAVGSRGSRTYVDGRKVNVNASLNVNEASDGKQIAEQFAAYLEEELNNTAENYQSMERDDG